jgi:hypothetical protein
VNFVTFYTYFTTLSLEGQLALLRLFDTLLLSQHKRLNQPLKTATLETTITTAPNPHRHSIMPIICLATTMPKHQVSV